MSAFLDTFAVMADTPNGFDELRIIAQDARLSVQDKSTLYRCADEWEKHQKDLVMAYAKLIETNQMLLAQQERLMEIAKAQATFPKLQIQYTRTL